MHHSGIYNIIFVEMQDYDYTMSFHAYVTSVTLIVVFLDCLECDIIERLDQKMAKPYEP